MPDSLAPYVPSTAKPWNAMRVQHLYSRLGFGASPAQVEEGLSISPQALAERLINEAAALPQPAPPYWADWSRDDYPDDDLQTYFQVKNEFFQHWVQEMAAEGPRARLALFWHNHFVTREEDYDCNAFMWSYYALLHRNAFGNFRTFVEEMGINPAMLVFLNGNRNIAAEPNENYARELMELFTMGEGNGYTQADVPEVARALTGWRVDQYGCNPTVTFNPGLFDNGPKTVLGQTGNWGYDDVHEIIFTSRADEVAAYICGKLYRHYLYAQPAEAMVQGLAATFKAGNWEIAPVLRQLFSSGHFFEQRFINARVRSPLEAMLGMLHRCGAQPEEYGGFLIGHMTYTASNLGQEPFNPVDVAGWQEHHDWLTENTLTGRWAACERALYLLNDSQSFRDRLRAMAMALAGSTATDPRAITEALATFFLNRPLSSEQLDSATLYFKGDIPDNYFEDGTWDLYYGDVPGQVLNLFNALARLPEWQLT